MFRQPKRKPGEFVPGLDSSNRDFASHYLEEGFFGNLNVTLPFVLSCLASFTPSDTALFEAVLARP
jgi:hypothetical protein